MTLQTPLPWSRLWLLVPLAVAASLLLTWRFGPWGLGVPVAVFAAALSLGGAGELWVWWTPFASLTGAWMGLREEGGGPRSGERAWMLLPPLLLAAGLPWMPHYPEAMRRVNDTMRRADAQIVEGARSLGYEGGALATLERQVKTQASERERAMPYLWPSALFMWVAVLVVGGRGLSARAAHTLRWPPLSRARLRDWRLPDGALWVFLAGLALLLAPWPAWGPTGATLMINTALGYCVQGIAVVESLLLSRGVPPSIIVLTLLFVVMVALPVFLLTTAALGLSDVWLDFRRLESGADDAQP